MKVTFWMADGSIHEARGVTAGEFNGMSRELDRDTNGDKRIKIGNMRLMVRHIVRYKVEQ